MASEWSIEYGPHIEQQFEKMDDPVVRTILQRVDRLETDPNLGKLLKGKASEYNLHSYRVATTQGEYRLIYQLLEDEKEILAIFVGSREDIYDRLERWLD